MTNKTLQADVDYQDPYVQPLLLAVLRAKLPDELELTAGSASASDDHDTAILQWKQYESIDFDQLIRRPRNYLANSYVIRKALIRKHYLANTILHWVSKRPNSILSKHVKPTIDFELDYAEFLDDALLEAYELQDSWRRNAALDDETREWWILKPSMSDKGQGIRLFSSEEELAKIFEAWDPESSDDEAVDNEDDDDDDRQQTEVRTSHLRHFVAQPYVDPPLLLPDPHTAAGRKFHIRTYVLAVGALKVYVYKPMLALFAARPYQPPCQRFNNDNLDAHLTNTCLQSSNERTNAVYPFWSLPATLESLPAALRGRWQVHVWKQICNVTAELFEAAASVSSINFQPLPNAFEIFGVDFLVDATGHVWLLEVNAFPDFAQTGEELSGLIKNLFAGVVEKAVVPFFGLNDVSGETVHDLVEVLDLDLGRR